MGVGQRIEGFGVKSRLERWSSPKNVPGTVCTLWFSSTRVTLRTPDVEVAFEQTGGFTLVSSWRQETKVVSPTDGSASSAKIDPDARREVVRWPCHSPAVQQFRESVRVGPENFVT